MKLIVGLGNPGKEYEGTRHNAGFMVLDKVASNKEIAPVGSVLNFAEKKKFKALIAETSANGEKVILVKPQTFMNLSGETVSKILQFYKSDIENLVVVSDDVDMPLGHIRVRHSGSSGGHKGLQNIIDTLGSDQFVRVRIGISAGGPYSQESDNRENRIETKDFVLAKFSEREIKTIDKVAKSASDAIVKTIGTKGQMTATTTEVK